MTERKISAWITIKHHHIPIYEGETKQDVINRLKFGAKKGKENRPVPEKDYTKKRDAAEKAVNALQQHQERVNRANELIKTDTSAEAQKEKLNADRTFKEAMQRYSTRQGAFDAIKNRKQIKSYEFRKKQVDKELSEKQDQISRTSQIAEQMNNIQLSDSERFAKENLRIKDFMKQEKGQIQMENGQILEKNTLSDLKWQIKEFKNNGTMPEDFGLIIKYGNGDIVSYAEGDDTSKMRFSDITGIILDNPGTFAYAGSGVEIVNYKELYPEQYKIHEDDWRIQFKDRKKSESKVETPKEPEYERTPKMDWIDKRIEGKQKELDKLEKKMERINKAKESDYKENNPYYYSDYDFRSTTKDIERAKADLEKYKQDMEKEIEKAKSRNVPVITEFLDNWEKKSIEYFKDQKERYAKAYEKHKAEQEEMRKQTRWDSPLTDEEKHKISKQAYEDNRMFKHIWQHVTQFNDGQGTWEENMRKAVAREKVAKYDDIITRTNDLIGQITDAGALHIGKKGDLNGVIIGTKGRASVETIGAGGYNIQRYHFRTLINPIKEKQISFTADDRWGTKLNNKDDYFIWKSGGIQTDYGEKCKLIRVTENHLVFQTESGTQFRTDHKLNTVGKAKDSGYFFTPKDLSKEKNTTHSRVHFK